MRWLMRLLHRDRLESELDRELRFHIAEDVKRLEREGVAPGEARRQALARFGGLDPIKEQARDARGTRWLPDLWQDLRYGARMLARSPGFTLAAVLSLAIGIGANAAMFSVADGLLLRALPVERPGELVFLNRAGYDEANMRFSHSAFLRWQEAFPEARFAARSSIGRMQVARDGRAELVLGELVTGEFFDVLGVRAAAGRVLSPGDTRQLGGAPVVVVSHNYWMRQLGGQASAVGSALKVNGLPLTVVGVAAPGFSGMTVGGRIDVWLPVTLQHDLQYLGNASMDDSDPYKPWLPQDGIAWLTIVARLPSGPAAPALRDRFAVFHRAAVEKRAAANENPDVRPYLLRERLELVPASRGVSPLRETFSDPLQVLLATTAIVLLIGCANLASLLLARGRARARELALRLSLGASRGRVVRQLLTESVMLACLGGVAGLAVARLGGQALLRMAATGPTPIPLDLPFDWQFVGFTLGVSVATGVAFGLAPAIRLSRPDLVDAIKSGGRVAGETDRHSRIPFGKALVVVQVTLALVLLVGAVLFLQTFRNLLSVDAGFEREHVLSVRFDARLAGMGLDELPALNDRLVEQARRVPGARAAAVSQMSTMSGGARVTSGVAIEGRPTRQGPEGELREDLVGHDYFETLGMPVVRGRGFRAQDRADSSAVAVVNEAMVTKFFGDADPIGKHIGYEKPDVQIVGVVRDARIDGLRAPVPPIAYRLLSQATPQLASALYVRLEGDADAAKPSLARAIAAAEPGLAVREIATIDELARRSVARERLVSQLTSTFGLLAVAVACLGLYATVSYSVARRRNEIGVRLALGASPANVRWLVLRETLVLVGIGVGVGLALVLPAVTLVDALLYGLSPRDPSTLASAAIGLLMLGALSGLIPAWRASRVDPIRALRAD